MTKTDVRVDRYIEKAADFAKPILLHIRKLVHRACPDSEETLKWGAPTFVQDGILCGMAAFKEHCRFILWKRALIFGAEPNEPENGDGHFGKITKISDLPSDKILIGYLKEAVRLNLENIRIPARSRPAERADLMIPPALTAMLKKHAKASSAFDKLSYSHKKEYAEWISEAKRDETRQRRLETTRKWLAEGKSRNWKYQNF